MKLDKKQINRLITFGRRVWNMLTKEEQENYYYNTGTMGFVEDIMAILHIHKLEFESEEQFEYVHELITKEKFTDDGEPYSLEVKGFYYGEPDEQSNKTFYGDLIAHFSDEEVQENAEN